MIMGTLRGFPNPPAMSSGRQSRPTLDAISLFCYLAARATRSASGLCG